MLRAAGFDAAEAQSASELIAALELKGYEDGTLSPNSGEKHAEWTLHFCLRLLFFVFALLINIWWDYNIRQMVWQSGRANSGFHLTDRVLMGLLTTTIANFIALLTIIARYLFTPKMTAPGSNKADAGVSDAK